MLKPLLGKTIIVTGSSKTMTVQTQIEELGGELVYNPLIETSEILAPDDEEKLKRVQNYDWLIFTSQNAVEAFLKKVERHQWDASTFNGKIAAVGSKTAKSLKEHHFPVSFIPSVFSADVFVKEFPSIAGNQPKCLFFRGSKAKDTLKKELPFELTEWTLYDTHDTMKNIDPIIDILQVKSQPIIIFASPSAVDVFAKKIAPFVGWQNCELAAIGHITAARIEHFGAKVTYEPKVYTMQAVIEEIAKPWRGEY